SLSLIWLFLSILQFTFSLESCINVSFLIRHSFWHLFPVSSQPQSIPQDIIDTHELQTITLDYRRECQHDDIVDPLTYIEEGEEINSNLSVFSALHPEEQRQYFHWLRFARAVDEINHGQTVWRKLAR
uniref:Acyl-ACP thioesterase-like C-terminal domain-containing protein n=1 Tax=Triticum urartu TaxID=4572 RepID=A0A8R7UKU6_TRIUA